MLPGAVESRLRFRLIFHFSESIYVEVEEGTGCFGAKSIGNPVNFFFQQLFLLLLLLLLAFVKDILPGNKFNINIAR